MGGDYPAARVQSRVLLAYDTTVNVDLEILSRNTVAFTCGIYKMLKKFQILACIRATVPVYYPLRRGLSAVGSAPPCQGGGRGFEPRSPLHAFPGRCESAFFIWRSGQVVRHGPAKPLPPVRIRASPPEKIGTRSCGCLFLAWASLVSGAPILAPIATRGTPPATKCLRRAGFDESCNNTGLPATPVTAVAAPTPLRAGAAAHDADLLACGHKLHQAHNGSPP